MFKVTLKNTRMTLMGFLSLLKAYQVLSSVQFVRNAVVINETHALIILPLVAKLV